MNVEHGPVVCQRGGNIENFVGVKLVLLKDVRMQSDAEAFNPPPEARLVIPEL